ncbi:TPA: ParA family protein [Legionella pneumophila]|nr:ParA family protein [Legionella pneumophila]
MAMIVASVGSKGGIGKSTFIKQLAVMSAAAGKKTVALDCDDKQNSIETWNNRRVDFGQAKYVDYNGNLNLVSESSKLVNGVIDSCIKAGFERIIVDLPGRLDVPQGEMLLKADFAFCPLSGSADDYDVLPEMSELLERAAKYKPNLILHVIYNKAHPNAKRRDSEFEDLKYQCSKMERLNLLPIYVKDVVSIKDAAKYGLSLFEFAQLASSNIKMNDHNIQAFEDLYQEIFNEKWVMAKEFTDGEAITETA